MKRVVIKAGSHILSEHHELAYERITKLIEFIVRLMDKYEVIFVTSGAIAAGFTRTKITVKTVCDKQALASVGQPFLMSTYYKELAKHKKTGAQLLLTKNDFTSKKRTYFAKETINKLLSCGVLPIINHNDATIGDEIKFGDNDLLSSRVAHYFGGEMLVLLSDVSGYCDANPKKYLNAKVYKNISNVSIKKIPKEALAGHVFATGGISTKLKAAQFLLDRDKSMFLASGFDLSDAKSFLLDGTHKGGTLFKKHG